MPRWRADGPPASGWGEFRAHWPALLAATVGVALSVSALPFYTAGVFVQPLQAAFGWSRGEIAGANTALFWAIGLASPIVGLAIDRIGVRPVVLVSMLALAAGFVGLSLLTGQLGAYVAVAAAMGFLGAGASAIAFTRVVNARFVRARGMALGICLMGSGLMGFVAPSLLEALIAGPGWRWAYRAVAATLVLALPLMLLLETGGSATAPPVVAAPADTTNRLGDRRFWLLMAAVILMSFATMGASSHLTPLLTDLTGSAAAAARTAGLLGASVVVTRIVSGWALDRVFAPLVAAVVAGLGAVACVALGQGLVDWSVAAVLLLGAALGAEFDIMAYLAARYFPPQAYGRIYGPIFGVSVLVSGLSPLVLGALYDRAGDYALGYGLATAAFIAAIPCFLSLGPYRGAAAPAPASNLQESVP
jgi:MFS family permease